MLFYTLVVLCVVTLAVSQDTSEWQDTETTSALWASISQRDTAALENLLNADVANAHLRSVDGRGPLFWAYEYGHVSGIALLEAAGVSNTEEDAEGNTPIQLGEENVENNAQRTIDLELQREQMLKFQQQQAEEQMKYQQQQQEQGTEVLEDVYGDEDEDDEEF